MIAKNGKKAMLTQSKQPESIRIIRTNTKKENLK
jgi:hypothetical protein